MKWLITLIILAVPIFSYGDIVQGPDGVWREENINKSGNEISKKSEDTNNDNFNMEEKVKECLGKTTNTENFLRCYFKDKMLPKNAIKECSWDENPFDAINCVVGEMKKDAQKMCDTFRNDMLHSVIEKFPPHMQRKEIEENDRRYKECIEKFR